MRERSPGAVLLIVAAFEVEADEDGCCKRKGESSEPVEVDHGRKVGKGWGDLVELFVVLFDVGQGDFACHDFVGPDGVDEYDG